MWSLTNTVIPPYVRWLAIAALVSAVATFGYIKGLEHGKNELVEYIAKEAAASSHITQAQAQVVVKTEVVYRDRVQKIYVQGKDLELHIPDYIKPADDSRFDVPAGFLRVADAAWAGEPAGPAADSDRGPAGVSFTELGKVEVTNATSCRVWREQALGWRKFYADQQVAVNGQAGAWYHPELKDLQDNRSLNASIEALQGEKHD